MSVILGSFIEIKTFKGNIIRKEILIELPDKAKMLEKYADMYAQIKKEEKNEKT